MIFKIVHKNMGAHTWFRMWAGKKEGAMGLAGELRLTNEEFEIFRQVLEKGAVSAQVIFEEQITSGPATRGNNGFHPA